MTTPSENLALVPFGDEGVLVDLRSGAYYRLNRPAMEMWSRDPGEVASKLTPPPTLNSGGFETAAGGFLLRRQGSPLLAIDRAGGFVKRMSGALDAELCLRWAAPHMLMLQRRPLLHASAVRRDGGVTAFCGGTGSGKSTAAAASGDALSDDLVLLDPDALDVLVDGEPAIRRWASAGAARFGNGEAVEFVPPSEGPSLPLREILFLDSGRRAGNAFKVDSLAPIDAFALLLRNSFAEVGTREVWSLVVGMSKALAGRVSAGIATVPVGVEALRKALRRK